MNTPDLGKMIGPLPLGGWLAAVGGSVVFAYVLRKRKTAAAVVPGTVASTAPANQYLAPDAATGGANGNGTAAANGPAVPTPASLPTYASNEIWRSRVYVLMTAMHPEFPLVLGGNAINNYLAGIPMTTAEQNYIAVALRDFGPPPRPPDLALVASPDRSYLPVPAPVTPVAPPPAPAPAFTLPQWLQDIYAAPPAPSQNGVTLSPFDLAQYPQLGTTPPTPANAFGTFADVAALNTSIERNIAALPRPVLTPPPPPVSVPVPVTPPPPTTPTTNPVPTLIVHAPEKATL